MLERIEETVTWDYPTEQAIKDNKPVHVVNPMIYAKYQIKADGRLVLTLRKSFKCDYVIEYYEPTDGE